MDFKTNENKIIIILPISTLVNENSSCVETRVKRKEQYINGITKLLEINDFLIEHYIDIILIDNTTDKLDWLDLNLINVTNFKFVGYSGNKYGAINKGSGLIESWYYLKDLLIKYKYIIHFEPRQLLTSHETITYMVMNPMNIFKILNEGTNQQHIYTGLFCIKVVDLLSFIHKYSAEYLSYNRISIEYALNDFMKNTPIKSIEKLNLMRFDYGTNKIELY